MLLVESMIEAFGLPFTLMNQFVLRMGCFGESQIKGPRRYFTIGIGIKKQNLNIDLSYLMVVSSVPTPLDNTLRLSASWRWN